MTDAARPGRRPTFTADIADLICERLSAGETLRAICRDAGMPGEATVRGWVRDDRDGFAAQYTRARELGYAAMADEMLEIADDASNDWMRRGDPDNPGWSANHDHINRSRLRVEARKWLLAKALPKIYGDKITQEHTGPSGTPLVPAIDHERRSYVDDMLKRLAAKASDADAAPATDQKD